MLAIARRFRRPEAIERLTQAKHRRNARRIEAAILRLRGLFIKVGQLISIMANFLPDAFREELERLQDQVPPRPYRDIEARVREEFGGRGPTRAVRGVLARAGRVGVDRPGPPGAPAQRRGGRGQGSVPGHRRDGAHRSAGAAPDLQGAALVHARLRLRHHLPRDQRDGARRARLPARGGGDREDRGQLRGAQGDERPVPARHRRVLDDARADHRVDGGDQGRAARAARRARRSIAARPRAPASRPTASRSSSTACTTPIRTPGTC